MEKKIINIVFKIDSLYFGGSQFLHKFVEDIIQQTYEILIRDKIVVISDKDFFVLYKTVSKAIYQTLRDYGYSKKLKKSESEIAMPFYNIISMTDSDFETLEIIRDLYLKTGYKSVIQYYNLSLDLKETRKLKKFLSICFPKGKNKNRKNSLN